MEQQQELAVVALAASASSPGNYSLVLEAIHTRQSLVLTIGPYEAQSIAVHMEQMDAGRPLSHELYLATVAALGAQVRAVQIYGLEGDLYLTRLCLRSAEQADHCIEARASDAIAIALRAGVPVFVQETVLAAVAQRQQYLPAPPTRAALETMLARLLAEEDYTGAEYVRRQLAQMPRGD
ncbi:MAG: bifunctional nuclease family protein [Bacteroidia bacterium]